MKFNVLLNKTRVNVDMSVDNVENFSTDLETTKINPVAQQELK